MSASASPPAAIHVGCAGYTFPYWRKGAFYPKGLKQEAEYKHYAGQFSAVEINTTFHGVPREETFARWKSEAPPGFVCVLKVPQNITHVKQLNGIDEEWAFFYERASRCLGSAMGPVLFQFSPSFGVHMDRLEALCALLPRSVRVAVEFRNADWLRADVYAMLRAHNIALVENITPDKHLPRGGEVTANWTYTRFHKYAEYEERPTDYSDAVLTQEAQLIVERHKKGLDQYVFFLNDIDALAPKNGGSMAEILRTQLAVPTLVQGWKRAALVTPGGKGSIESMFARASKKPDPPAESSTAEPAAKRVCLGAPTDPAPAAAPAASSPAKSSSSKGDLRNFFAKPKPSSS